MQSHVHFIMRVGVMCDKDTILWNTGLAWRLRDGWMNGSDGKKEKWIGREERETWRLIENLLR
jgi:hypothetical protein